jgi:hypothetical protein
MENDFKMELMRMLTEIIEETRELEESGKRMAERLRRKLKLDRLTEEEEDFLKDVYYNQFI